MSVFSDSNSFKLSIAAILTSSTSRYPTALAWNCSIITARIREVHRKEDDSGLRHVAFQVEDVAAHEKFLRAEGVEITLSTCDLPNLGARVLLFLDPNGVTIEFCENLPCDQNNV